MKTNYYIEDFWAKVYFPNEEVGFLPIKILVYNDDNVSLLCKRPFQKSIFNFINKPIPEKTEIHFAFHSGKIFELWSAKISKFLGFREGLDEYKLYDLRLQTEASLRKHERFLVKIPLKLKLNLDSDLNKEIKYIFKFSGCELSHTGIGLWIPLEHENKILQDFKYKLTFEPLEIEPFDLTAICVRQHINDILSKGFKIGFSFANLNGNNKLANFRIDQLIEARGKNKKSNLKEFWEGEIKL